MSDKPFIDPNTDNLDDFSALFSGKANPLTEAPEDHDEPVDEVDALDSDEPVDDLPVDDLPEPDAEPAPKPKKKTAQERIDELTAARRAAEREQETERNARIALENKLRELEARIPKEPEAPVAPVKKAEAPDPSSANEDGTAKYPLGEFDPAYIRDLTKYTIAEESANARAQEEAHKVEAERQQYVQTLNQNWNQKLVDIETTLPDFREKGQNLIGTFSGIDPQYGEFLSTTIMQMENGPEVLYHLANHIDEAQKIVAAGPVGAALALGRLEAKFVKSAPTEPRVSQAPRPAPSSNKGVSAGGSVRADTDDLDAFSEAFFSPKGKRR
jgi:hypothetical protein